METHPSSDEHGLENFGLEQALRFQDELEETFLLLAENPAMKLSWPRSASRRS